MKLPFVSRRKYEKAVLALKGAAYSIEVLQAKLDKYKPARGPDGRFKAKK